MSDYWARTLGFGGLGCAGTQAYGLDLAEFVRRQNAVPVPPARPRNIDPKRRMTKTEVARFSAQGLIRGQA